MREGDEACFESVVIQFPPPTLPTTRFARAGGELKRRAALTASTLRPSPRHLADGTHGVVRAVAIGLPEFREVGRAEIAWPEPDFGDRVAEQRARSSFVDGAGKDRKDRAGC